MSHVINTRTGGKRVWCKGVKGKEREQGKKKRLGGLKGYFYSNLDLNLNKLSHLFALSLIPTCKPNPIPNSCSFLRDMEEEKRGLRRGKGRGGGGGRKNTTSC